MFDRLLLLVKGECFVVQGVESKVQQLYNMIVMIIDFPEFEDIFLNIMPPVETNNLMETDSCTLLTLSDQFTMVYILDLEDDETYMYIGRSNRKSAKHFKDSLTGVESVHRNMDLICEVFVCSNILFVSQDIDERETWPLPWSR